jgi:hypothetical protein
MRRLVVALALITAASFSLLAAPAQAQPTLTLQEWCDTDFSDPFWGFTGTVSGLPPYEPFTVDVEWNDGTGGTTIGPIPADATGSFTGSLGTSLFTDRIDVTVTWAGGTLSGSVEHPCQPDSRDQCRNGGWRNFPGFKNEGQCVAFAQRGPKP